MGDHSAFSTRGSSWLARAHYRVKGLPSITGYVNFSLKHVSAVLRVARRPGKENQLYKQTANLKITFPKLPSHLGSYLEL